MLSLVFAGLTNSKDRPLGQEPGFPDWIPFVLSTASIEPTGLLSQGVPLTALYYLLPTSLKCAGYLSYTKVFYE